MSAGTMHRCVWPWQVMPSQVGGLEDVWPNLLWIVKHPSSGRYGCYRHDGIHGMACFSTQDGALNYSREIELTDMTLTEVTFEEAREIAKERPLPVVCMMLLDDMDNPVLHYVR